jgi:hypothetical protein
MMTEDLIDRLAAEAAPVRPLPPPWRRVGRWFAVAAPAVAAVVVVMSPRPDLGAKLADGRYLLEQGAAVATAVLAAFAAFSAVVPGRSRRLALPALAPLAVWLGSLGQGCLAGGVALRPDWVCIPAIAMTGAVPAAAMAAMLRRGAPLLPRTTLALGALAAAALANAGLRLFHPEDASLMVLVWQLGTVALLTALGGGLGRRLLHWRYPE